MWISDKWTDYEIIDTCKGRKLERWGDFILDRPDPQVIWPDALHPGRWQKADGIYHRSEKGGGSWESRNLPETWQISYRLSSGRILRFNLKPFAFKHTGVFPEQATNWEWMHKLIASSGRRIRVLNLFAYTGGATLASLSAGASVTHVDASKGMVGWAKENAELSGFSDLSVRWLFDDCMKFVQREIRRESKYDAIIMDPPSYGRGPKGEIWKMEEMIAELILACREILSDNPLFFLLNSYTTGLSPSAVAYLLKYYLKDFTVEADEVGLYVDRAKGLCLPCGASARALYNG